MPYRINIRGTRKLRGGDIKDLTDLQQKALLYLDAWKDTKNAEGDVYIGAAEVAKSYGYPNGQWFRGVLSSLHKRGLIDKKPGE